MDQTKPSVMVTGSTRNIGFAIAKAFVNEGYNVCITSRKADSAERAAREICDLMGEDCAIGLKMETSDTDQIKQAFADAKQALGRLDVFVPNAADPGYNQSILSTTPEQYDYVMNSNARGYFFCCQEAAKIMKEQGKGAIVLIGSVHSKRAIPNRITYASSKGAIDVMSRNMCYELGKYGIRSNVIIVGAVYNDRWQNYTDEDYSKMRDTWPLGMESYPEDIANAAVFLASDKAKTISGAELLVDSGVMSVMKNYNKNWDAEKDDRAKLVK